MRLYTVAVVILILWLPGCFSYAPPIRAGHYGAPGRLRPYEFEIGGEAVGPVLVPYVGGPLLSLALNHGLQVEAGTTHLTDAWAFGYGGLRYTPWNEYETPTHGAFDIEVGGGAGGVKKSEVYDAGGGAYAGAGIGVHHHWFSAFARMRTQLTAARQYPPTGWVSGVGGVEAAIARTVHVWASYGLVAFGNDEGHTWGPVLDVGLSLSFDTGLGNHRDDSPRTAPPAPGPLPAPSSPLPPAPPPAPTPPPPDAASPPDAVSPPGAASPPDAGSPPDGVSPPNAASPP